MKGRHTVRASTPSGREPRFVEPWTFTMKENTALAKLEAAYLSALESVDQLEAHKTKAEKLGTLTPTGVVSDTLQFAASTLAPALKKARTAVEQARREAEQRRAKLVLKPADKTDAAGQMRRLYKLDRLREMPDRERTQYLARMGDNLDPELQQAILEAPEHSGLLPSDIEAVHVRALKQQHGEEAFTELAQLEGAIKVADDVVKAAREEIAFEVGGNAKLDEAAAPYEKMAGAAWLKKVDNEVRAFNIRNGRGYWDPATAEEVENGMYFATADEWRVAQSGAIPQSMKGQNNGKL
jgi:hypothetical protein